MAKIVDIGIQTWGQGAFIVSGSFDGMETVSSRTFTNYGDALKEMRRMLLREEYRYENNIGNRNGGKSDWNGLPFGP